MDKQLQFPLVVVFATLVVYTCYGILQLGRQGGPCNAGIALTVLIPSLLICITLLGVSLSRLFNTKNKSVDGSILLTIISFTIWSLWFCTFYDDSRQESLIYLGPFEALHILILAFSGYIEDKKSTLLDKKVKL